MGFALVSDGQAVEYPIARAQVLAVVQQAAPEGADVCLPEILDGVDLTEFGIFPVNPVAPPTISADEMLEESSPIQIEGVWTQVWAVRPVTQAEIADEEARLLAQIDSEAGAFRTRFITDVPGQAETYLRKQTEAEAYAADPGGTYPMLSAEASARNMSIGAVAAEVAATAAAWVQLGAAIEGLRMGAKTGVRAASTIAGKRAAAAVNWEGLIA